MINDKLGMDAIEKVGPGGHFLNQKHTINNLHEEHYRPELSDRDTHELWSEKGRPGLVEKARGRVRQILRDHKPKMLDPGLDKELLSIIRDVEKREGL
jgi:trimethylamine--corrinoid protein Co-methyltransferase